MPSIKRFSLTDWSRGCDTPAGTARAEKKLGEAVPGTEISGLLKFKQRQIVMPLLFYTAGIRTITLNKSPSTSMLIRAPCKSTMDCAMAKPNPEPSV